MGPISSKMDSTDFACNFSVMPRSRSHLGFTSQEISKWLQIDFMIEWKSEFLDDNWNSSPKIVETLPVGLPSIQGAGSDFWADLPESFLDVVLEPEQPALANSAIPMINPEIFNLVRICFFWPNLKTDNLSEPKLGSKVSGELDNSEPDPRSLIDCTQILSSNSLSRVLRFKVGRRIKLDRWINPNWTGKDELQEVHQAMFKFQLWSRNCQAKLCSGVVHFPKQPATQR